MEECNARIGLEWDTKKHGNQLKFEHFDYSDISLVALCPSENQRTERSVRIRYHHHTGINSLALIQARC